MLAHPDAGTDNLPAELSMMPEGSRVTITGETGEYYRDISFPLFAPRLNLWSDALVAVSATVCVETNAVVHGSHMWGIFIRNPPDSSSRDIDFETELH